MGDRMSTPDEGISREDAMNALSYFGSIHFPPGGFSHSLMVAIARADRANRARLALAFPGLVQAMTIAMDDHDGIERLVKIYHNQQ